MIEVPLTLVISLIAIVIAVATLFFNYYQAVNTNRRDRYDFDRQLARIDKLRDHYEDKIYELNERMSSSPERFKDANHLLIGSWEKGPRELSPEVGPLPKFLRDAGLDKSDTKVEKDLVFVLTPFNDNMRSTYENIKSVCSNNDLRCKRGDEEFIQGDIFPHILRNIVKARLVIANINGRNTNVFYELGITHTLDKPTLIVAENLSDAPFDVRSKRMILYDNSSELKNELNSRIQKALIEV